MRIEIAILKEATVSLSGRQAHFAFMQVLDQLTEGCFIRDGILYKSVDMHGHGSDVHRPVLKSDPEYGRFDQITRAIVLYEVLKPLCYDFEPHHASNGKCALCGKRVD